MHSHKTVSIQDMQMPFPSLQDFNPLSVAKNIDIPLTIQSLCPAQNYESKIEVLT